MIRIVPYVLLLAWEWKVTATCPHLMDDGMGQFGLFNGIDFELCPSIHSRAHNLNNLYIERFVQHLLLL